MTAPNNPKAWNDVLQAEAFLAWYRRLRPPEDFRSAFRRWATSKDFSPHEAERIKLEVRRLFRRASEDEL
jgi:hypothetical protein